MEPEIALWSRYHSSLLSQKQSLNQYIMDTENTTKKRNSILWKGCFVLLTALVLQIPVLMVRGLVYDRKDLSNEVKAELVSSWGGMMEVTTPQLRVSYVAEANGKKETLDRDIKSSDVAVEAKVNSQIRHRSIYDIPVYSADLTINGKFGIDEKSLEGSNGNIKLMLPFNKLKGIEGRPVVVVGGMEYAVKVYGKELAAELPYDVVAGSQVLEYVIRIKTNGMDRIRFYPGASLYNVKMKSNYNSPGFKGDFLPVDRTISESGFEAQWIVTDLNMIASNTSSFDVEFVIPAGQYQQSERALKYSFLIILLVFVAIFLVESITRCRINIVQYIVTGLSLCLFYLLLLSISEYVSFGWSYVIAATMTTGALGGYFYGFLKSKYALAFTGAVACLYGFIYILLQMETGALLAGSIALFLLLCVVMYFTRRNDLFDQPRNPVIE